MSPAAKTFVSPSRPKPIGLDGAALVLELSWQPGQRRMLSDGDDDVVGREAFSRPRPRSTAMGDALIAPVNFAGCSCERFDLTVAEHGGHRAAVHQLDALLEHVVQILGHARHLAGSAFRP